MHAPIEPYSDQYSVWHLPDPAVKIRSRRQRIAILLCLIVVSIVTFAGTTIIWHTPEEYDGRDCRVSTQPSGAVTFLIDQSDPFSEVELGLLSTHIQRRTDALRFGDLLSLLTLQRSAKGQPLTDNFSRCRPLRGHDVSIWIDNPTKREQAYQTRFLAPLNTAREKALIAGESQRSPLIEALHAIALGQAFEGGGRDRTLVLYTDGIQNSALASFFERGYSFKQIAQHNPVYLSGLRKHFSGACVEMILVTTKYPRQTSWPEFGAFWRDYWQAAGVECLTFNRI
jgi:hypothetical protein